MRWRVSIFVVLVCGVLAFLVARKGSPELSPVDFGISAQTDSQGSGSAQRPDTRAPGKTRPSRSYSASGVSQPDSGSSNAAQRLLSDELELSLTPEQMETYLRQHGTNVDTVLATHGTYYLIRAAQLFPNDPRVAFAVITRDLLPEEKREWLDRFKQAAPENPIANYLSAHEYLRSGDREEGLKELAAAMEKPRFNDYSLEQWQNMEDVLLFKGASIAEAKLAASTGVLVPHLAMFKELAQSVRSIQDEHIKAGDLSSAETLASYGHSLAQHLMSGEGSRLVIHQLVGAAIEQIAISPLPADRPVSFLEGTVQQEIDGLQTLRNSIRDLTPLVSELHARGNDTEIISYTDRMKLHGEYNALLWLKNRPAQ